MTIDVRGISKSYQQNVLHHLQFKAEEGSIFALLGPNGAGKSTAVRMMSTLAKPDSGDVYIAGISIKDKAVKHKIGYVAQESGVNLACTGRENLQLQGNLYGLKGKELKARMEELLHRFSLEEAADKVCSTYSGGMKRKLDLAMGFIHKPAVLFLDEPTTALDPEARTSLWKEIRCLALDEKMTILLTTHYLEEADQLSDQLLILDQGKAIIQGTAKELKEQLGGETIELVFAKETNMAGVTTALAQLSSIKKSVVEGFKAYVTVEQAAVRFPDVMDALAHNGDVPIAASLTKPTLDDVYLFYTGKRYQIKEGA